MVRAKNILCFTACALVFVVGCSKGKFAGEEARDAEMSQRMSSAMPMADMSQEGQGPGWGGDKYDLIVENPFRRALDEPQSTFSIDVDTASYAKTAHVSSRIRCLAAARRSAHRGTGQLLCV